MSILKKLGEMEKRYIGEFGQAIRAGHPGYWGARCVLQLQYAFKLYESEGNAEDNAFGKLVADAIEFAWGAFAAEGTVTAATCAAVEKLLAPVAAKAKGYSLICVSHAHIDMNWMWGYDETVAVTLDTFRTMLDLMNEYPEFTFAQSQASVYRIVERHCPKMLEEIRRRVQEGRWEVTASTWVEADRNMPNLESMARHFLYTKQYLSKLLDIDPASLDLDYEPDTFGHHINVPEVLCDGGVKYYYHCRGNDGNHGLYNWVAPSGRQILVFRDPTWYNHTMDGRFALALPELCREFGLDAMLRVYGVGDHGGGPTRRDIEATIDMNRWPIFPAFKFGTYGEFYRLAEKNRAAYPVVEGELNFIFDGCYTTQTRQKKGNRLGEQRIAEAEGAVALAKLAAGTEYDAGEFSEAWKKVLFNQFHDILPGSGIVDTREYAMGQYQEAFATANTALMSAVRALSLVSDTSGFARSEDISRARSEGAGVGYGLTQGRIAQVGRHAGLRRLFTVYNPLAFPREELVDFTVWDWEGKPERMQWKDAAGNVLVHQLVGSGRDDYWGHQHTDALVRVTLPAMGYATAVLDEAEQETFDVANHDPRTDKPLSGVLENEFIRAELDVRDGGVLSLVDKETGREYVKPGCPLGVFRLVEEDTVRGMSAWTVGRYMDVRSLNRGVRFTDAKLGDQYARQSATYEAAFGNGSKLAVTVSLDRGERMLRFDTTVRWQEIGARETCHPQLQFIMPFAYDAAAFRYDVPMGVVERPALEMDVPAQSYGMPVNAQGPSLMLMSDCKYGYRGGAEGLSLTLIRSSIEPDPWPEVGEHRIRMAVAVSGNDKAGEAALAAAFCRRPSVVAAAAHGGALPPSQSLLALQGAGIVLSAVKFSEDGSGLIVRYYELEGKAGKARLTLFTAPKEARAVSLLEQPADGKVSVAGNTVEFEYRAYGVGNLLIRF